MYKQILAFASNVSAVLGIAVCAITGIARVTGYSFFYGYDLMTLFIVGVALMVFAILAKVEMMA